MRLSLLFSVALATLATALPAVEVQANQAGTVYRPNSENACVPIFSTKDQCEAWMIPEEVTEAEVFWFYNCRFYKDHECKESIAGGSGPKKFKLSQGAHAYKCNMMR